MDRRSDSDLSKLDRDGLLACLDRWNVALARQGAKIAVTVEETEGMPLDNLRHIVAAAADRLDEVTRVTAVTTTTARARARRR